MAKLRVGLLFGGRSGEHEVSIASAQAIAAGLSAIDQGNKYTVVPVYLRKDGHWLTGPTAHQVLETGTALQVPQDETTSGLPTAEQVAGIDLWFPILHGPNGEDGTVQGLLTLTGIPFVGSGVLGAAVGMDKLAMKTAFAQAGLPQVKYVGVTRSEIWSNPCIFPKLCDRIEAELDYPCFVKPANLGSSVGISKVRSRSELETALDSAASYDRRIIVEAGVVAREIECAVLGNDTPKASVLGEIAFSSDFYDYAAKYTAGQANLTIPANLPESTTNQVREMAVQAFQAVDAAGISRVDFFYVEATGEVLINEINTMPGFTATSMYPMLWAATGLETHDLLDQLVQLALERRA